MTTPSFKRLQYLVIALIVLGGILPLLWYWATTGAVPGVHPEEAILWLTRQDSDAILLDVRPAEEFERQHVQGAHSWPLKRVQALNSLGELPAQWRGIRLLVMGAAGFSGVDAARHLQAIGVQHSYHVRGGLQEWIGAIIQQDQPAGAPFVSLSGAPAFRTMSLFEQWAAVVAAYLFKPWYMVLSLLLALSLWRTRAPDLAVLKWSMLAFFSGEAWCAVNYLVFKETSYLAEFLHSYGMVVGFGLFVYSLIEGLDARVMRLSAWGQRCAALDLCGPCIKSEEVDCGARKVLLLLIAVAFILGFIPLQADFSSVSYNTSILGTAYNYKHLVLYQVFEKRYCPGMAMALLATAFVILWRQPRRPLSPFVWVFFSAGLGALAFSFFRLLFGTVYENHLIWSTFWEELTELVFLCAIWGLLLLFRHILLAEAEGIFPWPVLSRILQVSSSPGPAFSPRATTPPATQDTVLIACEVLKDPIMQSAPVGLFQKSFFLDYGLHRYPDRLREEIQTIIDRLSEPSLVVFGYGLCGNGLRGIKAGRHTLLVPRADDCIPLLLGSNENHRRQAKAEPATFYLSKGWLKSGSHPLNEYEEYVKRYGRSQAEMIIDTQYRHIRRVAFVAQGQEDLEGYRRQAQELARFCQRWGARYEEILGDDAYIRRLVEASQDLTRIGDDFFIVPPGGLIQSHPFLRSG